MADETVLGKIEELVAEEHALQRREEGDATDPDALAEDRRRLREVSVELDRCWDLLRRRRASRSAGEDAGEEEARDASTVEGYMQ